MNKILAFQKCKNKLDTCTQSRHNRQNSQWFHHTSWSTRNTDTTAGRSQHQVNGYKECALQQQQQNNLCIK